jgi:hypothetical protein
MRRERKLITFEGRCVNVTGVFSLFLHAQECIESYGEVRDNNVTRRVF